MPNIVLSLHKRDFLDGWARVPRVSFFKRGPSCIRTAPTSSNTSQLLLTAML